MDGIGIPLEKAGFKFDNCARNEKLVKGKTFDIPKVKKTGTTIAGFIFKDGVILGSDTRATEGNIVAEKLCKKIAYIQPNIYCCGAGTAADIFMVPATISSQLELHRLNTGRQVPVIAARQLLKQMLFRYQGYLQVGLIIGGIDKSGSHIYAISPHGSTECIPYKAEGSGSLAAMAVLECRWKPDIELEEAKLIMRDAIAAGILHDLGSGSTIDICIITKDGANFIRPYDIVCQKGKRAKEYTYARGTTEIISIMRKPIEIIEEKVTQIIDEPMES